MKSQDIRDKLSAHLRAARRRLGGSKAGEEQQRLDIDEIIRLHCEAEMARLTASVQRVMAKADSEADSQHVRMLDFGCVARQETLGDQSSVYRTFETRNHACI